MRRSSHGAPLFHSQGVVMDASSIVSIVAVSLTAMGAIGTGVWFASKLAAIVDRIENAVVKIEARLDDHHDRIVRLEVKK